MKNQKLWLQLMFSALVFIVILGGGFLANLLEKIESIDDQIRLQARREAQQPVILNRLVAGGYRTALALPGKHWLATNDSELQLHLLNTDQHRSLVIESIELFDATGLPVALIMATEQNLAPLASYRHTIGLGYIQQNDVSACVIRWRSSAAISSPTMQLVVLNSSNKLTPLPYLNRHLAISH